MYAIVDIETTGGHAHANGITEIAIVLYDGEKMEGRYHTLINPGIPVPRYITSLTGISNEMLYGEPAFEDVADNIYNLLQGRIFVAHNVNFDYSFIKYHLAQCGHELNEKKLCTVRLSRKLFPRYARYNLGAICRELNIRLDNAHRASGDAAATTELFARLLQADDKGHIRQLLKGKSKEQYLPPQVPAEQIDQLPPLPGVYYFHNNKVQTAVRALRTELPTFAVVDEALHNKESQCCLLVENGQFYGMGYIPGDLRPYVISPC